MTVFCIGEAMGEIALTDGLPPQVAVGGDVFNTAVYLAHLGVPTAFVSALGEDPFGQAIRHALARHRVADSHVAGGTGSTGIYTISTDAAGERSFHYWRDQAPARRMLAGRDLGALARAVGAGVLYLSGITLWVLRDDLPSLFALLDRVRDQGGQVVFDSNFRARLWGAGRELPRSAAAEVLARAALALLTFEDEQALWGDASAQEALARVSALGCRHIVVKRGADPCLFGWNGVSGSVPVPHPAQAVDTTAAGDSFNAGFLARWRQDPADVRAAARAGHVLAGEVVRHRGALLPDALLQDLETRVLAG